MTSRNVKSRLFLSLALLCTAASARPLACGTYRANGKLILNNAGDFVLTLGQGTLSPQELILLGRTEEKLALVESFVTAKIYVPAPIQDLSRPIAYLKEIKVHTAAGEVDQVKQLSPGKCGQPL